MKQRYPMLFLIYTYSLSKGGTVATYAYQSAIFKCQIWTLREVPQPQLNPKEKLKFERLVQNLSRHF